MVSQYADASSVMGANDIDTKAVNDLVRGEYSRSVGEKMPRDYVQMYHPDGTTSLVQLPPLGRNGKNAGDRQRKIMHYILNKRRAGQQWWFASPPAGWQAAEMPWKCPVQECTRAGGLKDLLNLWRHITSKHPGEVQLYEGVLTAIKKRLSEAAATDLDTLFKGGDATQAAMISDEDLQAAKFEDASTLLEEDLPTSNVTAATFVGCQLCDWTPKEDAKQPEFALSMHMKVKHPEVSDDTASRS